MTDPGLAMPTSSTLTPAQAYLAERKRRYPPRYVAPDGIDRALQLYRVLAPELPQALQDLVTNGTVAIGEVGWNVPDVRTLRVAPDGFVVEFTSGMMDFQYAVGRALSGLDAGLGAKKGLRFTSVVALTAHVLRRWARYTRWSTIWPWRPRVQRANFPVTKNVHEWTEMMVTVGELFILAHELGHVALGTGLCPPVSGNEEEDADLYGLQFFLPAARKHWHIRVAYAGPITPIRNLAALERLGVRFSEVYPPQADRIRLLREQILKLCPTKQYFHEVTTIMNSTMDMMDNVENHVDRNSPPLLPDAERMLIRLIAELEDVAKGKVQMSTFIQNIRYLAAAVPPATMRGATATLYEYYSQLPPPEGCFIDDGVRVIMFEKLIRLIDQLPPDLKTLFPELKSTSP